MGCRFAAWVRGGSQGEAAVREVVGEVIRAREMASTIHLNPARLSWGDKNPESHAFPPILTLS